MKSEQSWKSYSMMLVDKWIRENCINKNKVERIIDILNSGTREDRIMAGSLQCPEIFCPKLRSQPWYDKNEFPWAKILESKFDVIKSEFDKVYSERNSYRHPENNKLAKDGVWGAFYFYRSGQKNNSNLKKCPELAKLLEKIDGVESAGSVFFATLSPNSKIIPHYGPHNFRIRCHMGLIVPNNGFISVGNIKKNWEVGKCIVFDDSFIHHVENNSNEERVILILDVWHPDFNAAEVSLLKYLMSQHIRLLKSGTVLDNLPEAVKEFV